MAATRKSAAQKRAQPNDKRRAKDSTKAHASARPRRSRKNAAGSDSAAPRAPRAKRRAPAAPRANPAAPIRTAISHALPPDSGPIRVSRSIAALLRTVAGRIGRRFSLAGVLPWR